MTFAELAADIQAPPNASNRWCRVVAVDGMSGSGKTGFARRLAHELTAPCISTDDMVPGWDGLDASIDLLVKWVLRPVSLGEPARWQRYNWVQGLPGEWVETPVGGTLVIDGCCAGVPRTAPYLSYLVWIDTPAPERRTRLQQREDWPDYAPFFNRWALQEAALQDGAATPERADLIVDNSAAIGVGGWGTSFAYRLRRAPAVS